MEDKETISLKSILVKYLRRWKLFLFAFLFSFIPAILYLTFYPRTYDFVASVLLQDDKESGIASLGLGEAAGLMKSFGIGSSGGSVNVDDEIAIIKSNRMLRLMILDLGMNVKYSKLYSFYNMYNEAPLKLTTDSLTMVNISDRYDFKVSVNPGSIKVKAKSWLGGLRETLTFTSLPANIKIGPDEFILDFDNDGASKKSFKLNIQYLPAGWVAESLEDGIEVEDVSSSSNVLMITCSEHSVERGKDMLNTLIDKYNEDMESYKRSEDKKTMQFVDDRISTILADLATVESELEAYKTKNEMTLLESDVILYSETIKELQVSIIEAESQARIISMLDEYVRDPENRNSVVPPLLSVADGEHGIISTYNTAVIERDKFLKNSNEKNPMFRIADNQVNKLRDGVYVMVENARRSADKTLEELKRKETELFAKMKTVPKKEREYVNYRRDQEILQGIYLLLLQKREETMLSLGKQEDRARVIEPAFVKKKPAGPRKLFAAIGMILLTIILPVGYIFAKELLTSIKEEYKRTEN